MAYNAKMEGRVRKGTLKLCIKREGWDKGTQTSQYPVSRGQCHSCMACLARCFSWSINKPTTWQTSHLKDFVSDKTMQERNLCLQGNQSKFLKKCMANYFLQSEIGVGEVWHFRLSIFLSTSCRTKFFVLCRYHKLDTSKTLKECLNNKTIIEFPTLHVVLADKAASYISVSQDETFAAVTESATWEMSGRNHSTFVFWEEVFVT